MMTFSQVWWRGTSYAPDGMWYSSLLDLFVMCFLSCFLLYFSWPVVSRCFKSSALFNHIWIYLTNQRGLSMTTFPVLSFGFLAALTVDVSEQPDAGLCLSRLVVQKGLTITALSFMGQTLGSIGTCRCEIICYVYVYILYMCFPHRQLCSYGI